MKTILILIALTLPVAAQHNMPKTVKLHDKATGAAIGTITINGANAYLRDNDGTHLQTITVETDGSRTVRDPRGNILKTVPADANKN